MRRSVLSHTLASGALLFAVSCTKPEPVAPSTTSPSRTRQSFLIAVNQYVEHPNLSLVYEGFRERVDAWAKAHDTDVTYDRRVAGADAAVATQIAQQQVAKQPALILALATPSAQAAAHATNTIPIVFGAITDPVAAGLVKSLSVPGGNVTGSSDIGPYEQQFGWIRSFLPKAKTVGVIRNPGEANSVSSMALIDPAMQKAGFRKVEVAVANPAEVLSAARSLVGRADILYMPADNTVLSALPAVAGVANQNRIPLFVGDEGSVELGAAGTIGIDYHELGRATGDIAVRILEKASPGTIPVAFGTATRAVVNPSAASKQGLTFPPDILKSAKVIGK